MVVRTARFNECHNVQWHRLLLLRICWRTSRSEYTSHIIAKGRNFRDWIVFQRSLCNVATVPHTEIFWSHERREKENRSYYRPTISYTFSVLLFASVPSYKLSTNIYIKLPILTVLTIPTFLSRLPLTVTFTPFLSISVSCSFSYTFWHYFYTLFSVKFLLTSAKFLLTSSYYVWLCPAFFCF